MEAGALVGLVGLLAAGCGDGPGDNLEEVAFADLGFGRVEPAGRLKLYESPYEIAFSSLISSQPVRNPCLEQTDSVSCSFEGHRLKPKGVLAYSVRGGGIRAWESVTGREATIAGHEARLVDADPLDCSGMFGDAARYVYIRLGSSFALVTACIRGPDIEERERELLALLDAAELLPP